MMFLLSFSVDNTDSVLILICTDRSIKAALDKLDLSQNGGIYLSGISRVKFWFLINGGSTVNSGSSYMNPWSISTVNNLLQKMNSQILKYQVRNFGDLLDTVQVVNVIQGKCRYISSLQKSARNKIKGCAGKGAFAQVYKACLNNNADDLVALKIQKPSFPWDIYMYCQLDKRIAENEVDPIKFQNGLSSLCPSSNRWSMLGTNNSIKWNGIGHGEGMRRRFSRVKVATDPSPCSSDAVVDDYYAVLGLARSQARNSMGLGPP
ncbi:hypothetical protein LXL04_009923 [Taraxacum kok-saghyz]